MANRDPDTPYIYVASLTDYNSGRLHGEWIDATQDPDDIFDDIQDMLARSPANRRRGVHVSVPAPKPVAEEWAIHDFENFGGLNLSQYESIENISAVGQLIEEHGEMVGELVDYFGGLEYLDDAREALEERFAGSYDELVDWAYDELEDLVSELPEWIHNYIDYQSYARDAELGGSIFTVSGSSQLHVFRN